MLTSPFPYFGGKSRVAREIWRRIGDVCNYIEPFCGSAAVLLLRPQFHTMRMETINDADAYVANFWRATSRDPEAVAGYCDWPVNEADLEARHKWLVEAVRKRAHAEKMRDDPDYYDARIAGWWCWGLAQWIGSGWCAGEWHGRDDLNSVGRGTHGGDYAKRPHLSGTGVGEESRRGEALRGWFGALRDRLRNVRVACGDWRRVCDSDATTLVHVKTCGVFLDPPYSKGADRTMGIYAHDSGDVAHEVRAWCETWGDVPGMRIALCGYEGEGHEALEKCGWTCFAWKASGGYANRSDDPDAQGKINARRERIWFSPQCIDTGSHRTLFEEAEV